MSSDPVLGRLSVKMRKIVQISPMPALPQSVASIIALCDDGTVWQMWDRIGQEWLELPVIPQDPVYPTERMSEWEVDLATEELTGMVPDGAVMIAEQTARGRTKLEIAQRLYSRARSRRFKVLP